MGLEGKIFDTKRGRRWFSVSEKRVNEPQIAHRSLRRIGCKGRRHGEIMWIKNGARGVWKGQSGKIMADSNRKKYAAKPRDVNAMTRITIEWWIVHK
jgi:hypothetical protein